MLEAEGRRKYWLKGRMFLIALLSGHDQGRQKAAMLEAEGNIG
ncbi:hypothetical protein [Okeania sp. SIO3B5]|nr:hypothetical protein [Okeania sp. SIO3B5]